MSQLAVTSFCVGKVLNSKPDSCTNQVFRSTGTHTGTERPYLKTFFRARLEETLNEIRQQEKLDDQPYEVIMSEHEEEVIQYV